MPFTWYWWMDVGGGHTRYSALYADLAIALVYVAAMTLLTEWLHRLQNKAVVASILIASAGLSVILLRWHTSLHYVGDFGYREFYGALFYWKAPFDDSFWRVDSWPSFLGNVAAAFTVVMLLSFVVHAFIKRRRTIAVTERSRI